MPIHESTTAVFLSKHPHTKLWLELEFPQDHPPVELVAALKTIGWVEPKGVIPLPPLDGRIKRTYAREGIDRWGWNDAEKKKFLAECRALLRRYHFHGVPHHKLTLAELI